jgi:predicted DNA-binding transcriptional regulator AlpA
LYCKTWRLEDMADKKEKLMTVKDVAEYLQLDEHTIYRMARKGKIPAYKVAG